jgi:two-component system cell cycle response regulator
VTQRQSHTTEEARSRVLVVDDSRDVHDLLRVRLKHDEIDLITAESVEEGFAKAIAEMPELVLVDLALPNDGDGLVLLRKLQADTRTQHTPCMVLSARGDVAAKVAAFDLGAVDYVTKPFELVELRVRLRAALRLNQMMRLLAQRARIDGLTGLWNRAYFDNRWTEEYSRSSRQGHSLALALIDIDHFKSVNDNYGHPVGDSVLQSVARVLQRDPRASDVACRYGGEEFVLIMPDTSAVDAAVVCERLRHAVSELRWSRVPDLRVSVSMGVVGATGMTLATSENWVEGADRNLYAAKKAGRNRTVVTDLSKPSLRTSA